MSQGTGLVLPAYVGADSCRSCRFSTIEVNDRVCRRYPPQVTILLTPAPAPHTGTMLQTFSSFPVVQDMAWCGQFERKPRNGE